MFCIYFCLLFASVSRSMPIEFSKQFMNFFITTPRSIGEKDLFHSASTESPNIFKQPSHDDSSELMDSDELTRPDENELGIDYPTKPSTEFPDAIKDPKSTSKVFDEIIEYIKQKALESAQKALEDDKLHNLPAYKSITDKFEFGYKGKGRKFLKKNGILDPDTDFARVPLVNLPRCHRLIYISVVINRADGEPPAVHLDIDANEVIIGFPRRYERVAPATETSYQIRAYSERDPTCLGSDGTY